MAQESWKDIFYYTEGHTVEWMRGGEKFFDDLVQLINKAEKIIHLQYYIIDPDTAGYLILDALKAAAQRNVEVNLVVDGFGSGKLKEADELSLRQAGIVLKRFKSYIATKKFYVGRRMHHKILVVDDKVAVVAGMNLADRYRGTSDSPPWLDYAIKVQGPVCSQLANACKRILERQFRPSAPKWPKIFTKGRTLDTDKVWVRIRKNDWLRNRGEITLSYNRAVRMATETITIVGGYFLPGSRFRKKLANASKRGVQIRIIMTDISDVPVVKYASDYLYGWLLRNNVRIFETEKSMVHGKVAIVDETWATIGSYNQNHLSAYFSIELNLDVVNREFAKDFHKHLLKVIETECREVTREMYYQNSSVLSKLRRWISYQLVRIMLRVLFVINRIFVVND